VGIRIAAFNSLRPFEPANAPIAGENEMYNRVLGMIAEAEAALDTAYGLVDRLQGNGFDQDDLLMIAEQKRTLDNFHDEIAKRFRERL
jgi:hypothetical protein